MTTFCLVEWLDGLTLHSRAWQELEREIEKLRPDILVTIEMPFGRGCPTSAVRRDDGKAGRS
jgi:N-carbamoylputrescine amidase